MRCLLFALVLVSRAAAQAPDTLTAADGWRSSLQASVAGNQSAYRNWQEGGVDAVAVTAGLDGRFDRVVGRVLTTQSLRLAYGMLRQDTLDWRKALDLARYAASVEQATDQVIRPSASLTVRSQFTPGFDDDPEPERYPGMVVAPGVPLKVSDVLSPLVLGQSVGVAVRPGGGVVARTGVGLKETVVAIQRLRPVYGNALGQAVRVEAGLDLEVVFEREVMDNVTLRSRLASFQGFGQFGSEPPDAVFENLLVLTVNDLLNVTLDASALFDADISNEVQLREALSVGLALAIL